MRTLAFAAVVALLLGGCSPAFQGYSVRESRSAETRRMAQVLDPLLVALELPSLQSITAASRCRIGFAVVHTPKVNVWSTPATESPCLYFSLLVTEGALAAPTDELMAMIAHELGHLTLHHTPQSPKQGPLSEEQWRAVQRQELDADRFAVGLLKRMTASSSIASCEAMGRFLRRGVADWYGETVSTRMEHAISERVESADAACAATEVTLAPPTATEGPF
jgi:Zn-dependent protease with chaperone function